MDYYPPSSKGPPERYLVRLVPSATVVLWLTDDDYALTDKDFLEFLPEQGLKNLKMLDQVFCTRPAPTYKDNLGKQYAIFATDLAKLGQQTVDMLNAWYTNTKWYFIYLGD